MEHVRISGLQKAFALADKWQQREDISIEAHQAFRQIMNLIWKSCGDGRVAELIAGRAPETQGEK